MNQKQEIYYTKRGDQISEWAKVKNHQEWDSLPDERREILSLLEGEGIVLVKLIKTEKEKQ